MSNHLNDMKELTNEELIKQLQQFPLDAIITIVPCGEPMSEHITVQYNDHSNEIVIDTDYAPDEFGIFEFLNDLECRAGDWDDDISDIFNSCGIW